MSFHLYSGMSILQRYPLNFCLIKDFVDTREIKCLVQVYISSEVPHPCPGKSLKGTVVYRTCLFINERSLEISLSVPLSITFVERRYVGVHNSKSKWTFKICIILKVLINKNRPYLVGLYSVDRSRYFQATLWYIAYF